MKSSLERITPGNILLLLLIVGSINAVTMNGNEFIIKLHCWLNVVYVPKQNIIYFSAGFQQVLQ